MGTRSGSIDPEIPLYLLRHGLLDLDEVERELEHESGLRGLAGTDHVRELEASDEPEARLALAVFCHRVAAAVAAMATALGGLDALVFTAGIGEGSAPIRARICRRLRFLGVELDERANASAAPDADFGSGSCTRAKTRSRHGPPARWSRPRGSRRGERPAPPRRPAARRRRS
jgi:acetate kinase